MLEIINGPCPYWAPTGAGLNWPSLMGWTSPTMRHLAQAKGLEFGIARTPFHDMYQQCPFWPRKPWLGCLGIFIVLSFAILLGLYYGPAFFFLYADDLRLQSQATVRDGRQMMGEHSWQHWSVWTKVLTHWMGLYICGGFLKWWYWWFPKMVVPQINGWFIMENPI